MIEFIPGILFTWLAIWILFAFTANLLYPIVRRLLTQFHPATSSALLLAWVALPAFSALVACLLLFAPALALIVADSQCPGGRCGMAVSTAPLVGPPAAIIGFWLVISSLVMFRQYWLPAHRLKRQLLHTGTPGDRFVKLASATPAAFTLGWLGPRIFLTDGLLQRCDEQDITCILNHEEAHRRRRDNLCQLLARLFTVVLPGKLIRRQLQDYNLFCEQACDLEATLHQPADQVASTLLKVARLQSRTLPSGATTFVGGHIEERIKAVLTTHYLEPNKIHGLIAIGLVAAVTSTPAVLFHWLILR